MENELLINTDSIEVVKGSITFPEYERIKESALKLATNIKQVEVTEENVKESKKMLATVNKRVKQLEDERIKIKKVMMEPYDEFEEKVKEIVAIVKEADEKVREQVRELEEKEREAKEKTLAELYNKRKMQYQLGEMIPFEDFLEPKHLNKSVSIESVEKEMVEFLERTEKDYEVIKTLDDTDAHVSAYLKTLDLAEAISRVNKEKARMKEIEALTKKKKEEVEKVTYQFTVYAEKDKNMIETYLKLNGIQYNLKTK